MGKSVSQHHCTRTRTTLDAKLEGHRTPLEILVRTFCRRNFSMWLFIRGDKNMSRCHAVRRRAALPTLKNGHSFPAFFLTYRSHLFFLHRDRSRGTRHVRVASPAPSNVTFQMCWGSKPVEALTCQRSE